MIRAIAVLALALTLGVEAAPAQEPEPPPVTVPQPAPPPAVPRVQPDPKPTPPPRRAPRPAPPAPAPPVFRPAPRAPAPAVRRPAPPKPKPVRRKPKVTRKQTPAVVTPRVRRELREPARGGELVVLGAPAAAGSDGGFPVGLAAGLLALAVAAGAAVPIVRRLAAAHAATTPLVAVGSVALAAPQLRMPVARGEELPVTAPAAPAGVAGIADDARPAESETEEEVDWDFLEEEIAASPAVAREAVDHWQRCRIRPWRGYVSWRFYAEWTEDGEVAVVESPPFRAKGAEGPDETEQAAAAHGKLLERLRDQGWMVVSLGTHWYDIGLRRSRDPVSR